jgi:hypothetical protein
MWTYEISTGRMYDESGKLIGVGYSGSPTYKNDASATYMIDEGPIPAGLYTIKSPVDTAKHGPYVLWLLPDPSNEMYGRADFGIHGDNIGKPGCASEGCIIQSRDVREFIWDSGDHILQTVVQYQEEAT